MQSIANMSCHEAACSRLLSSVALMPPATGTTVPSCFCPTSLAAATPPLRDFRPTGFPLRPPRSLALGCFFLCCATPTPLPRCPCAPLYSSSRLSPPSVLPLLAKA
ncbi:unnamed protein product, partial [Pylaiella littoralis]